ncbi:beta-microseminoprotein-like, partial [Seriola lalandi dorsalis]|uniref:beta-microseminoprotein-like n=1 Tax=Seriola lalandi dorsalis TaxID=1841481 RepID=UPI000C6F7968
THNYSLQQIYQRTISGSTAPLKCGFISSHVGCTDRDGKQYDFGSEVVIDCMSCSCTNDGLSCCDMIPSPNTVMIPMECEMIVNRQACSFKLVLKSDNTKECSFF